MDDAKLAALMGTITPLNQTKKHAKIVLYGGSGAGKTVLSTTVGNRILYVDSHEGWVSLDDFPELKKKCHRMQYLAVGGLAQLEAMCEAFEQKVEWFMQFDTIVLDEASQMAMLDLDVVLAARSKNDPSKDPNVATQPDYNSNTQRMRRLFSRLVQLDVNLVIVAHQREDKDNVNRIYFGPDFTPKLSKTIKQFCHIVGRLTAKEVESDTETKYEWSLQVRPTTYIDAKCRIRSLPVVVKNPNLGTIIDEWQASGSVEEEGDNEVVPDPTADEFDAENSDNILSI